LPKLDDIQGIHGTIALTFLLLLPFFALYSFHLGYRRLVQGGSFRQLKQFDKPTWWVSIHHLTNTLMLFAATFAVLTGRMMKEEWLPAGEIHRGWYLAHLGAWLGVFVSLALHLLLGAKVGGLPWLMSMFNARIDGKDKPPSWLRTMRMTPPGTLLKFLEIVVMGGIIMAFIMPLFNALE
jgi:hypothetical protein